jgi:hypothetical protein
MPGVDDARDAVGGLSFEAAQKEMDRREMRTTATTAGTAGEAESGHHFGALRRHGTVLLI